jgi:hypothetical protein
VVCTVVLARVRGGAVTREHASIAAVALAAEAGFGVGRGRRDRPKMSANAAINSNRDFGQIAGEILQEAAEIDRREDEFYGRERGDELPEHLRTREGRRKALPKPSYGLSANEPSHSPVPSTTRISPR